ncbi:uncharacterized protein LOC134198284 isoform X2 [Corticium candelabrum]|nr:uncharacterized protein LOC134198284 isoform X2 [Corticium candelabrum]
MVSGEWVTDKDGVSGCKDSSDKIGILSYCQKIYRHITVVSVFSDGEMTISGWCNRGNYNCIYTSTKPTYVCVGDVSDRFEVPIVPRVAFWCGKVNQHVDMVSGEWVTDTDGVSGCIAPSYTIGILRYCQKTYPQITVVRVFNDGEKTISRWCNRGNDNCIYNSTKPTFVCVGDVSKRFKVPIVPRVAFWCGKVNQHADMMSGEWVTDKDGVSGCIAASDKIGILRYCQKIYPQITVVRVFYDGERTISSWCNRGNRNCIYNSKKTTFACVGDVSDRFKEQIVPRVAFWCGKVNQHVDMVSGEWVTDKDGVSGCIATSDKIGILRYCRKTYPHITVVRVFYNGERTISRWCNRGNHNCIYNSTKTTFACVGDVSDRCEVPIVPRVAFWCGKVNQHVDMVSGDWVTDKDGVSGCIATSNKIAILRYCQKTYPHITVVRAFYDGEKTISRWCTRGNLNCIYNSTKTTFVCVGDVSDRFEVPIVLRVAFWCGKVNQHVDMVSGEWVTDKDGVSGCIATSDKMGILRYCQKTYPQITVVRVFYDGERTISRWCNRGNRKCIYNSRKTTFACVGDVSDRFKVAIVPRVAFWCGKVNQHVDMVSGEWVTDKDGVSGCIATSNKIGILRYCQKTYPHVTVVRVLYDGEKTISRWCDRGNYNCIYHSKKPTFVCVER